MTVAPSIVGFATDFFGAPQPWENGFRAAPWMMLGLLIGVLTVAAVFVLLARRQVLRNHKMLGDQWAVARPVRRSLGGRRIFGGGPPTHWLAVKCADLEQVRRALGLENPRPFAWRGGFQGLNESACHLALTPPLYGWVLVIGPGLARATGDVDDCFKTITAISRDLGLVQFFSVDQAVAHHTWAQALNGRVIRAYSWQGETVWNQGDRTLAEKKLDMHCERYGETPQEGDLSLSQSYERANRNVDKIYKLASMWSVDPTTLDESMLRRGDGIIGEFDSPISM